MVTQEQLDQLIADFPPDEQQQRGHATFRGGSFDVPGFLTRAGLEFRPPKRHGNGAVTYVLHDCPFGAGHGSNWEIDVTVKADGTITAGCKHKSCSWGWRELRARFDPDYSPNGSAQGNYADYADFASSVSDEEWGDLIPFHRYAVPEFPVYALPDWIAEFVAALATFTQTPPDMSALLCLSAVAVAVARKMAIRVAREGMRDEPLNIYTVTALPPAARKTPAFAPIVAPIEDYESECVDATREEIAEAETRRAILQGRLEKARAKASKDPDQALEDEATATARELANLPISVAPRLLVEDVTPESLGKLLAEHDGRLAVMSDEGGIFDLMAGRYSSNGAPNFDVFLKAWSAGTIKVDRIGRGRDEVKGSALTMGLAVQPEVIQGLAAKPGFGGRGLLARFLYAVPRDLMGERIIDAPEVPGAVLQEYHAKMSALLSLPFGEDRFGKPGPHLLYLEPEARKHLMEIDRWMEPQLKAGIENDLMRFWAGKWIGQVTRVAGLIHAIRYAGDPAPWQYPLDLESMQRASRIGEYLIHHARIAFGLMAADPTVEDAKRILKWASEKQATQFSERDLFNGLKGRFQRVETMRDPLSLLCRHNYLRAVRPARTGSAGRPLGRRYEVNPAFADTEPSQQDSP